jgi:CDP-glucose 4,6-dehydratase
MPQFLGKYSDKRILVTGHTGFKGTWLTRILVLAGAKVYGLSLLPEKNSLFSKIADLGLQENSIIDLRDFIEVNSYFSKHKFDGIFHLAAQPLVIESYKDPIETFQTNVMGTAHLLQSVLNNNSANWVVITTTDKVYKNEGRNKGFLENNPLGGEDPYSASKTATEMVINAWRNLAALVSPKFKFISVRAGNVIGGGDVAQNRLVPDLIRNFHTKTKTSIRNPKAVRPWQYVLDPLNGYLMIGLKLLSEENVSNSYNFGPGKKSKITVEQLAKYACTKWDGSIGFEVDYRKGKYPESEILWLSSKLAKKELNWVNKLEVKDAIDWTINWEIDSNVRSPLEAMDYQIMNFYGQLK